MMNVTKYLDSSSPNICKALWSAKVLDSVVLTCCRMDNDAAIKFLEITMENVVMASYNLRGGGDLPYEEIALNYATIKYTYIRQKEEGGSDGNIAASHDLKEREGFVMKEERRIPLLSRLAGKASGRGLSRSEYLLAVAEDVEELLNTRAPCGNGDAADSAMGYGLADWSSAPLDGREVARAVSAALERFEPRLKKIRVSPLGFEDGRLHLRVDAASEEEPVTFLLQCDGGVFSAGAGAGGLMHAFEDIAGLYREELRSLRVRTRCASPCGIPAWRASSGWRPIRSPILWLICCWSRSHGLPPG